MSQIIRITSEALQATVRRLLPSQQGFGEDLQASNVILPVIDVTPTAEGSQLTPNLQNALAYGDLTPFTASSSTVTIANSPGFYRIYGISTVNGQPAANINTALVLNDGTTDRVVWNHLVLAGGDANSNSIAFDLTVFLDTNHSVKAVASANAVCAGSTRQVADRYGNLSNPAGFTFE